MEKFRGLREDHANKIGLRLGPKKLAHLTERQIKAHKAAPSMPISSFAAEEWVMNDTEVKP